MLKTMFFVLMGALLGVSGCRQDSQVGQNGQDSIAAADDTRWKLVKSGVVADTFSGMHWTQSDNLGDINWNDARAYCANLQLDGDGWHLPKMNDLSQLYHGPGNDKVPCGAYQGADFKADLTCRASKLFNLTGPVFWSRDRMGTPSSEAYYFYLLDSTRHPLPVSSDGQLLRALCVRHSFLNLPRFPVPPPR